MKMKRYAQPLKSSLSPALKNCNHSVSWWGGLWTSPVESFHFTKEGDYYFFFPPRNCACSICRPTSSKSLEEPILNLLIFPKLHFHRILGYRWIILQLHAPICFLLMHFFSICIFFLRCQNFWSLILNSFMRTKGASFSRSLASLSCFIRYNFFFTSKWGNHRYLQEKNYRADRGSPRKALSV